MNNIISSNPDTWPDIIRNKYGINIDEHFWENNPLLSFGSGFDMHRLSNQKNFVYLAEIGD